ncbi:MAG: hypothetical protein OXC03_07690 [Flavobacteriaceae bacterium]|nr:hypothetical protein [Flavobacteriaceae bacterium]
MKKFLLTTIALFAIHFSVAQIGPNFKYISGAEFNSLSFGAVYKFDVEWDGFELQAEANYSAHKYKGDGLRATSVGVNIFSGTFSIRDVVYESAPSIDARGVLHFFPIENNDAFFLRGGAGMYFFLADWFYGVGSGYNFGVGYNVTDDFSFIAEYTRIGFWGVSLGIQYIF